MVVQWWYICNRLWYSDITVVAQWWQGDGKGMVQRGGTVVVQIE